jgi:hypothetical protein
LLLWLAAFMGSDVARAGITPADVNWDAWDAGSSPTDTWDSNLGFLKAWANPTTSQLPTHMTTVLSAYSGINSAYHFDGVDDVLLSSSFSMLPGDPSDGSTTFEFWIRPDSLTGGEQVIFESGKHNDGFSITLNDDQLLFQIVDKKDSVSLSVTLADFSEFTQVAAVLDQASGVASLYINGTLVTTADASGIDSWTSGHGSGLGGANGSIGGDLGDLTGYGTYAGQISILRFYESALTAVQVQDNFDGVVPEPATGVLVGLGLVGMAGARRGSGVRTRVQLGLE